MKNGLLAWNVVLTLIAGYLLFIHFTSKKQDVPAPKSERTDTVNAGKQGVFKMAYFDIDSIEAHYELVKVINSEVSKKEDNINLELDQMNKRYQNKLAQYQGQQKDMTPQQYEAAAMDLKKTEGELVARKQELDQQYQVLVFNRKKEVRAKIEDFLKEYNSDGRYSYIISYEQGLFFYYRDTTYNITNDVIKGLNQAYRASKKD